MILRDKTSFEGTSYEPNSEEAQEDKDDEDPDPIIREAQKNATSSFQIHTRSMLLSKG